MAKDKAERVKIITPEFRASYPTLFQARKVNQNDPNEVAKFSVVMLFRVKETPESKARGEKVVDLTEMREEIKRIVVGKLGTNWQEELKKKKGDGAAMYRLPFRDGAADDCKNADGTYKEGFGPGVIYLRSSSQYKPGVVDAQKKEIMNPQDVKGGDYMRAQLHFYWYDTKGNKGVTSGLDNVQKIRDGEAFSGRQKAEDAFDACEPPAGPVPVAGAAGASSASEPWTGM